MNTKIIDVKCIRNYGKLYKFPLTIDKVYYDAVVTWDEDGEEEGSVTLINDEGNKEHYSIKYFVILD